MEEKYTIRQIIDAIMQAEDDVVAAIAWNDKDMLEDAIKDFLN